jgi:8-oxo-dGTP diphosphatase
MLTVYQQKLQVVLVNRREEPFSGKRALPGGFVWDGESAQAAAQRILRSKVGAEEVFFEQLYTFDSPGRDPRGRIATIAYYALVPEALLNSGLQPETRLVPVADAAALAFDHGQILQKAITRMRYKLLYSNIAYSLLPESFTLSQLQAVYETMLGHELDKRNFRKKILSLGLVEPTGAHTAPARHRPANLYTFRRHGYAELDEPAF